VVPFVVGAPPRRSTSSLDVLPRRIIRAYGGPSAGAALLQGASRNTPRPPAQRLYKMVARPPPHVYLGVNDPHGGGCYPGMLDERLCDARRRNLHKRNLGFWGVP